MSGINSRFSSRLKDLELILASASHPKFKLPWYSGDDLISKRIVDETTKLVNEKLVIEKELSNSSSGSEDNPETLFNILGTSSKTNEGAQLIKNYLDGPLSTTLPCPSVFACEPLGNSSSAIIRRFRLSLRLKVSFPWSFISIQVDRSKLINKYISFNFYTIYYVFCSKGAAKERRSIFREWQCRSF